MTPALKTPPDPSTSVSHSVEPGVFMVERGSLTPLGPRIVHANEVAARMTGYETESLIGSPLGLIYDNADLPQLQAKFPKIAQDSGFFWMDRNLILNSGARKKMRWTIRPTLLLGKPSDYFTLTVSPLPGPALQPEKVDASLPLPEVDGSAQQAGFHKDASQNSSAESRSEALALTAGGVAHDFKNALHSIQANLELAKKHARPGTDLATYLEEARFALQDAEILAHQMLAFTRGTEPQRCLFDLAPLIQRVSRLCMAGSRVRCRLNMPASLERVNGDPNQIYQVLHNLVINACQAMPNGGTLDLTLGGTVFEEANNGLQIPPGHYLVISIRDRGCGIPPEILPRIFEKNFSTKDDGSGFGLASCKAIIDQHAGHIRAASKVGIGTEFLVFLPCAKESSQVPTSPAQEATSPQSMTRVTGVRAESPPVSARILVVEDQESVARATCGMLKCLGHDSAVAATGDEAIRIYRRMLDSSEPVDLVLLDMTLPGGLDGREVFEELRQIDRSVRVIATSGYFEDGPSEALSESGFIGVLAKPYTMEALAVTITHALTL